MYHVRFKDNSGFSVEDREAAIGLFLEYKGEPDVTIDDPEGTSLRFPLFWEVDSDGFLKES